MTPVQIAYFKHFLYDTGIQKMYVYRYRHFRLKDDGEMPGNPESLEQFFMEQPIYKVIMKAFYFEVNSQYGFDFWNSINEKWKKYWEMNEDNINNTKYMTLRGSFSILRQNWDKPKFWKDLDTSEETYKRMNIEPPQEVPYNIKSESSINDTAETASIEKPVQNKGALLEGFSLVETINTVGGKKMRVNDVSINLRNGGYRITFSAKVSEKLKKHNYEYVKFLTNYATKEIALVFNHLNGCKITIKKNGHTDTKNVTINSKDIVEHIHNFYHLNKMNDYFTLEITDTIQQDTNTIFKLKLKQ